MDITVLKKAVEVLITIKNNFNRKELANLVTISSTSLDTKLPVICEDFGISYSKIDRVYKSNNSRKTSEAIKVDYSKMMSALYELEKMDKDASMLYVPQLIAAPFNIRLSRLLMDSMYRKKIVDCDYKSRVSEVKRYKLSLLKLVKIDNRYHFRAFNHLSGYFGDYIISRFTDVRLTKEDAISIKTDKEWYEKVSLNFAVNPEQNEFFKKSLMWEFQLSDSNHFTISTTKALANYYRRIMTRQDFQTNKPAWIEIEKE